MCLQSCTQGAYTVVRGCYDAPLAPRTGNNFKPRSWGKKGFDAIDEMTDWDTWCLYVACEEWNRTEVVREDKAIAAYEWDCYDKGWYDSWDDSDETRISREWHDMCDAFDAMDDAYKAEIASMVEYEWIDNKVVTV
jgi:hypothetical protein